MASEVRVPAEAALATSSLRRIRDSAKDVDRLRAAWERSKIEAKHAKAALDDAVDTLRGIIAEETMTLPLLDWAQRQTAADEEA